MISLILAILVFMHVTRKWWQYKFLGTGFLQFGLKRSFTGIHDKLLKILLVFSATTTIIEMYNAPYTDISYSITGFIVYFFALIILNSCYSFWLYDVDELLCKYISSILENEKSLDRLKEIFYSDSAICFNNFTIQKLKNKYKTIGAEEEFNLFVQALKDNFNQAVKSEEFWEEHYKLLMEINEGDNYLNIKQHCVRFIETNTI